MNNRRLAIAGLALATALGLAGCGTSSDKTPSGAPSAAAGATTGAPAAGGSSAASAELAAAAAKLGEDTVRAKTKMGSAMSMTGVLDPKGRKAEMAMTLGAGGTSTKVEIRQLGNDLYLKFDGSLAKAVGESWMHVDATKLKAGSSFNQLQGNDPAGTQAMVKAMTDVQKTGANGYRGTLDLTKTPQYNKDSMKAMGAKASAVPFTATTDGQGRLVALNVEMESLMAGAGTMETTYSDFGAAVDVKAPPASKVKELPANMAGLLNA
jgi:hypothetical protein